jgi:hypothetical protein
VKSGTEEAVLAEVVQTLLNESLEDAKDRLKERV